MNILRNPANCHKTPPGKTFMQTADDNTGYSYRPLISEHFLMQSKITRVFAVIATLAISFACDRPVCKNANPIFDQYPPESEVYKAELARQLEIADKSTLRYWFSAYVESKGQTFLHFNIQGDGLCAIIVLNVDRWNKLGKLRQNKGVSFRGAEFTNLTFDIRQDSTGISFIFRDYGKIID